jgi:hypothetical protein
MAFYRRANTGTTALPLTERRWTEPKSSAVTGLVSSDVGSLGVAGSSSHLNGSWTVKASGLGKEAGYHFAHQAVVGDWVFTARVASVSDEGLHTADAGIMFREHVDRSPATSYAWLHLPQTGGSQLFWRRGTSSSGLGFMSYAAAGAPCWLRLVRRGNFVYGYTSPDGRNWSPTYTLLYHGFPDQAFVGLACFSGDNAKLSTAVFDNVSLGIAESCLAPAPTGLTAIAMPGGVKLDWSPSKNAVCYTIMRAEAAGGIYSTLVENLGDHSYVDGTTAASTAYLYSVCAASYGGLSSPSTPVSVATT